MKRLAPVALLLLLFCGKRGDPRPPVPIIPQATSDLVVTQRGENVILSWSYPALSTTGRTLNRVDSVTVYRYVEELPVPQAGRDPKAILPGDIDPTIPQPIALFARIPTLAPPQFEKLREKVDTIPRESLTGASVGSKLFYEDRPPFRTSDGRPVRVTYAVVTAGGTTPSALSNLATIVPLEVAPTPTAVRAIARAEGVALEWTLPQTDKPHLGFNIYRSPEIDPAIDLTAPVNASPVRDPKYVDTPPYGAYRYRVTTVSASGPPRIESEPSAPVTATFKDLTPPPPPANLTVLVGTKSIRLVWDAVDASDLHEYNVYRTEGTIRIKLPSTSNTHYEDIGPDPGISYFYSVTSTDKSGNESAPVHTEKVLVPKTP